MDKNVYAAIQSQYATFSKVGKQIADHIIADPVHITSISIQQMAAELGIAESSIIRFCKILGCTGFSEMKLLLAKYSPKSVRTIFEDLSETDSIQTISESVFGRNIDTLERALQLLDFQKIEQAVDVLSRAENILVLGVGASGTIAEDFYIRLMRIGFRQKCHRVERNTLSERRLPCGVADRLASDADSSEPVYAEYRRDRYLAHRQDM